MPKIVINNPMELNKTALFGWGGTPYEIKPGETQILEEHLAAHARKHNPHLRILDESMGALSFAESNAKFAEERVVEISGRLAATTTELKKAQSDLVAARSRLKAEQQARDAEIKALTTASE